MKNLLLCLIFACTASVWLMAQPPADPKGKAETRNITGCLAKGDGENEFLLTASDGSTWEVRSDSVALADHVGHAVSAKGVVEHPTMHNLKEDAKDAAHDAGVTKDNTEHGHLKITRLNMVSDSCSK